MNSLLNIIVCRKCRLEGELRRTEKGMEMTYSPLDQLTGTKEFWNLTSTDLLSFARQISVAMVCKVTLKGHFKSKYFVHVLGIPDQ